MTLEDRVRELVAGGRLDEAVTAVLDEAGASILGFLGTLHDEDDAEDVYQRWAEDVWHGLPAFRGECSLRSWLYRLAWHASARFRRQPWERRRTHLPTSAASRLARTTTRSRAAGERDERMALLWSALAPEDRTLLTLRLDLELSWEEVAEVLGADGAPPTVEALRKRFQRLKDRLGQLARERGLLG